MKKYFIIAILCILIDQITKYLAKNYFTYSTNTGAVFGILQNQTTLLILLTFFAIGFLIYYTKQLNPIALGLIFGGLIGNLIDRITYQHVIDFIKILNYPAFNLADIFIVVGVILSIYKLRRSNL